jgi:hypothetical protein
LNIEASQPIHQMPRDRADRGMTPAAVRIGKAVKQGRGGAGQGDFEVQR